MHRPARTFVLPVPLSRMLAAYTPVEDSGPNFGTRIIMPVNNPIKRLKKEVERRADIVGTFPNEGSIMRLIGAVLFEQKDDWQTSSRYRMVEAFARIETEGIAPLLSITTKAA